MEYVDNESSPLPPLHGITHAGRYCEGRMTIATYSHSPHGPVRIEGRCSTCGGVFERELPARCFELVKNMHAETQLATAPNAEMARKNLDGRAGFDERLLEETRVPHTNQVGDACDGRIGCPNICRISGHSVYVAGRCDTCGKWIEDTQTDTAYDDQFLESIGVRM